MLRRCLRVAALAAVGLVAAISAGCGDTSSLSSDRVCILTVNGNRLCNENALAWCNGFQKYAMDTQTVQACEYVRTRMQ